MGLQPGYWSERIFVVVMMIVGFLLCSTILSQVVLIFHKLSEEASAQADMVQSFKEFLVAGKVPFPLQQKVKRYLEYQFKSRKENQMRRFEMMENLSPWLRKELTVHLNRSVLCSHAFFSGMPEEILASVCCMAISELCAPSDVVAHNGEIADKMYFVVKGRLQISRGRLARSKGADDAEEMCDGAATPGYAKSMTIDGYYITAPGYVGASSLFKDEVRSYTVMSVSNSELLTISKEDIHEVLVKQFPAIEAYITTWLCKDEDELNDSTPADAPDAIGKRSSNANLHEAQNHEMDFHMSHRGSH